MKNSLGPVTFHLSPAASKGTTEKKLTQLAATPPAIPPKRTPNAIRLEIADARKLNDTTRVGELEEELTAARQEAIKNEAPIPLPPLPQNMQPAEIGKRVRGYESQIENLREAVKKMNADLIEAKKNPFQQKD